MIELKGNDESFRKAFAGMYRVFPSFLGSLVLLQALSVQTLEEQGELQLGKEFA